MTTPPLPERSPHRLQSPAVALGLLALWLIATLGLRPLLVPDEGRYANVAREMLQGDALVPTLNGLPFFHKPPLLYWLDMTAMWFVGVNEFAARFGSMIGAWMMGAALFFALRRWHGARAAAIGVGVLATCPFFFLGGQYVNHDMLVGGLITVAVLAFARAVDEPPRVSLRWLIAAWCACAFAMLAKGLIGFVLPALVIGPWLLAQGRWRQMLALLHPLALLAFVIVAAPWFVAMQLRYPGFFDYFIVEQHFRRYAQSNFNNAHPFWFFLVVLPAFTLPWAVWLPAACKRAVTERRVHVGLCAWWIVAIVGFFSLPSSKLVGYVLPALAPWCVLLTVVIVNGRVWRWLMPASAFVCVAIVVGIGWKSPSSHRAAAFALAAQMEPGDRVVMFDEYFYDLPFYARLTRPVLIASDWADPELPKRDNWRKEVFDAARFDPALGRELLWPIARIDELSCRPGTLWIVANPGQAPRLQTLVGSERVYADANTELWRAASRRCP